MVERAVAGALGFSSVRVVGVGGALAASTWRAIAQPTTERRKRAIYGVDLNI